MAIIVLKTLFCKSYLHEQNICFKDIDHRVTHVLRAHNTHADMLANKALDQKIKLPRTNWLSMVQDA